MSFSKFEISAIVAPDSTFVNDDGQLDCYVTQTKDLKSFCNRISVAPGVSQFQVDYSSSLTTVYRWAIVSDYPIMFRLKGSSADQYTMVSGTPPVVNVGAPTPYQCFASGTTQISSLYLQPIANATQTATVKVLLVGDPLNAYT